MRKRIASLWIVLGMLLCALMPLCALADAEEVSLSLERVSPDTMSAAGNVTATFTIRLNVNASDSMENVTVSKGGTVLTPLSDVKPGYSPTHTVSVPLTDAEIGNPVTLTLSWTQGGIPYTKNLPSFTVNRADAVTSVVFTRSADPTAVKSGEKVKLKYRVVNTGNVTLSILSVSDGVLGNVGTRDSLSAGETWEFTQEKTVTEAFTSAPVLTYTAAGEQKTEKLSNLSISLASVGLETRLTASAQKVESGEDVTLTCKVENTGSLDFQSLTVKDETLGQLHTSARLLTTESTSFNKTVKVTGNTSYTFVITAVDENGTSHTYKTNTVTVEILEPESTSAPVTDETIVIAATADTSRMLEFKEVTFHFEILNRSADTFTDVVIKDDRDETLLTLASLPSGTTSQDVVVQIGQDREIAFYLTAKATDGNTHEYISAPISVRLPEVTPTAAPIVTAAPTSAPTVMPGPTSVVNDDGSMSNVWLIVGIVLLGIVLVGAVIVLIVLVPGIIENARVMRSHRERMERDATRRVTPRNESAPRRNRRR